MSKGRSMNISEIEAALRRRGFGRQSVITVPTPYVPTITVREVDGSPTGEVRTVEFNQDGDNGLVVAINGPVATIGLAPIYLLLSGARPMEGALDMDHFDINNVEDLEVEQDATVGRDLTVGRNQTFLGGVGAAILSGVRRITMAGIGLIEAIRKADFTGSAVGEGIIDQPRVIHMAGDDTDNEARIDGLERTVFNDEPTKSVIQRPSVVEFNTAVDAAADLTPKRGQWSFDEKERMLVTWFESIDNSVSVLHKIPLGWVVLQCVRHPEIGDVHLAAGAVVVADGGTSDYGSLGENLPSVSPLGGSDAVPLLTEAHRVMGLTIGDAQRSELVAVMRRGRWHTATLGATAGGLVWADTSGGLIIGADPGPGVRVFVGTVIFDDATDAIVDVDVKVLPTIGELSFMATVTPADYFVPVFDASDSFWTPKQLPAVGVTYDPSVSSMTATDVQAAIDELAATAETQGFTALSPAGAINVIVWRAPYDCVVLNVRGYRVGGSGAAVNARKNGSSDHLASDLSLTSADTWMDGGTVQNASYAAGDKLEVKIVSVAGSPTQVAIQVDLRRA